DGLADGRRDPAGGAAGAVEPAERRPHAADAGQRRADGEQGPDRAQPRRQRQRHQPQEGGGDDRQADLLADPERPADGDRGPQPGRPAADVRPAEQGAASHRWPGECGDRQGADAATQGEVTRLGAVLAAVTGRLSETCNLEGSTPGVLYVSLATWPVWSE